MSGTENFRDVIETMPEPTFICETCGTPSGFEEREMTTFRDYRNNVRRWVRFQTKRCPNGPHEVAA